MTLYDNLPLELRGYQQWVCWRYDNATKLPYCPKTGHLASVSDPTTWTDFNSAVAASGAYNGIGFVLTQNDPFAVIDLDDPKGDENKILRNIKIWQEFNSYTEISPSGKGLHIIIKGVVPHGRKREGVEIYSAGRYITMTGNLIPENPSLYNEIIGGYHVH